MENRCQLLPFTWFPDPKWTYICLRIQHSWNVWSEYHWMGPKWSAQCHMVAPCYWRYAHNLFFSCVKSQTLFCSNGSWFFLGHCKLLFSTFDIWFLFIFLLHLYRRSTHCRVKDLSWLRHVLATALRPEYVIWGVALFPLRLPIAFLGLVPYSRLGVSKFLSSVLQFLNCQ